MKSEKKNGVIGAIVALFFATTLFAVQPPNTGNEGSSLYSSRPR